MNKSSRPFFVSGVLSCNTSARFEKLRWPVMIVKLRIGEKYSKNFENSRKFQQNLAKIRDIKLLHSPPKPILLSQETIQYTYIRLQIVSLAHKDP